MTDRISQVVADLDDAALRRQFHPDFSPIGWHLGHAAWQRERWLLRELGEQPPLAPDLDDLFDTFRSKKGTRGRALPDAARLHSYVEQVDAAVERWRLQCAGSPAFERVSRLADNHERQHVEIVLCVRLLGELYVEVRDAPDAPDGAPPDNPWLPVHGGRFTLGCSRAGTGAEDADAWDNEHEAHETRVAPFLMQRFPVSEAEWLAWMRAGGYERREWWSPEGWAWRTRCGVVAPGHWERSPDERWWRRTLSGLVPAGGARPVAHLSWFEAEAHARSRGARLPTEAEWECAASGEPGGGKRRFPWGAHFDSARADVGRSSGDCSTLGAHSEGLSPSGIEHMCGGVWEWVSDCFRPYPGFAPGLYAEYSAPWFGVRHRVARGGSWLTSPCNARTTFRNWYEPHVREPCLGVRLVRDP